MTNAAKSTKWVMPSMGKLFGMARDTDRDRNDGHEKDGEDRERKTGATGKQLPFDGQDDNGGRQRECRTELGKKQSRQGH